MNTLDRYIARQYLFNVVALLVVLFSFVVAVDVALNIDKFLQNADEWMKDSGGGGGVRRVAIAAVLVVDLWWPRLLQLFSYLVGLVLVAAMGFTFTQMVRHREMVAVLASGVSLFRLARPIVIVAVLILGLKVINQEFVLSRREIAPLLTRDLNAVGTRDWTEFPVRLRADAQHKVFLARKFDPAKGEMTGVYIWDRDDGGGVRAMYTAEKATWRSGGWDLTGAKAQSLALSAVGTGNAGAPMEAPSRIESDLDPATLKFQQFAAFSQTLSWSQIGEMLQSANVKPELRDTLQRVRWSRVSQFLSGLLSLLITMPFYLVREPRNMLVQTLKSAPLGIASLMGGVLLSLVPWPELPAGFAVFIPVFVLVPLAVAMLSTVKS